MRLQDLWLQRCNTTIVLAFLIPYACIVIYLARVASRDPTSFFFKPEKAYDWHYSTIRRLEADQFILDANDTSGRHRLNDTSPRMCVGITSAIREDVSYLSSTVGSLLEGLTTQERDSIHLIVLIASTDPQSHSAYSDPWLSKLVDDILVYDLPDADLARVVEMERQNGRSLEKGLFDYAYLLNRCIEIDAPHIAIVEDDVLALDGWYHRTLAGLDEAERRSGKHGYMYLRLFYTEQFLGWNSEYAADYLAWSLIVVCCVVLILDRIRAMSTAVKKSITPTTIVMICIIPVPLTITLFFLAGRQTMMPLSPGINSMNKFGCCTQGLVFPRQQASNLVKWYEEKRIGYIDTRMEEYCDIHHQQRWALTPSVLQHIGGKSSKGDDLDAIARHTRPVSEKLWNFAFELHDEAKLHEEHVQNSGDAQ